MAGALWVGNRCDSDDVVVADDLFAPQHPSRIGRRRVERRPNQGTCAREQEGAGGEREHARVGRPRVEENAVEEAPDP